MDNQQKQIRMDDETRAVLARVRKTISDSNALLDQMELRKAETDRMLAAQGLTREQVARLRFTPEQLKAANEELKRRGLPPIEESDVVAGEAAPTEDLRITGEGRAAEQNFDAGDAKEDLENRRRKFNVMKNNFRI